VNKENKKEWVCDGYICDEDDPPRCYFCGITPEKGMAVSATCYLAVYCCDDTDCTIGLGDMAKTSYFELREEDKNE